MNNFASIRRRAVLVLLGGALAGPAQVIRIRDTGAGNEYMSGNPITLPAASLGTNLFRAGTQVISNRLHTARAARFDPSGRLAYMNGELTPPGSAAPGPEAGASEKPSANGIPPYLEGRPYVWFLQNVRHYTNYACTVTVDRPSTFYLLVDNRVNDYAPESPYDDPCFGLPDTQWLIEEGWERVDTGLTPLLTKTNRGDYVGIDEGNNGSINQVYAVYSKRLARAGSITLRTELDGNIYCLVVSTNVDVASKGLTVRKQQP